LGRAKAWKPATREPMRPMQGNDEGQRQGLGGLLRRRGQSIAADSMLQSIG